MRLVLGNESDASTFGVWPELAEASDDRVHKRLVHQCREMFANDVARDIRLRAKRIIANSSGFGRVREA